MDQCIKGHSALVDEPRDIVFVDNGSGGELEPLVKEWVPGTTIVVREDNGFFCGGYNAGLRYALENNYDYALIVNADTEVINKNYVNELVAFAEMEPDAAFIGPRVSNGDASTIQNTILDYPWLWRYTISWLVNRIRPKNRSAAASQALDVEFLNGVCVLCRMSALKEVGLLDETMGGYVEDADWTWRARESGWKSKFLPVSSIVHHQEGADYHHYSMKSFMLRRNHVYWHWKSGRYFQAFGFMFASGSLALLRVALSLLSRNEVAEHWHFFRRYGQVCYGLVSRRKIGAWFGPPIGPL